MRSSDRHFRSVWRAALLAYIVTGTPHGRAAPIIGQDLPAAPSQENPVYTREFTGSPLVVHSSELSVRLSVERIHDPRICGDPHGGFLHAIPSSAAPLQTCQAVMARLSSGGAEVAAAAAVLLIDDQDVTALHLTAAIGRFDAAATQSQVFFTAYTGGLHCCMTAAVATHDGSGWLFTYLGEQDGDAWQFRSLDGELAPPVIVGWAPGFAYAFSSYAESNPPTRILRLAGTALLDVTAEKRYRPFLMSELRRMEAAHAGNRNEINGFLAGWVAQKALVGEADDAWRTMLATYDHRRTAQGIPFPRALAGFLVDHGYVTRGQVAAR